jgi:hypothetical protein
LLPNKGVDVSEMDESGNSPLASYFESNWLWIDAEFCQLLLSGGGRSLFIDKDRHNLGLLYARTSKCKVQILEILNEHGVGLTQKDLEGKTILHCAAIMGSLTKRSFRFLLHVIDIQINAEDVSGEIALQHATEMASKDHHLGTFDRNRWNGTMSTLLRPVMD